MRVAPRCPEAGRAYLFRVAASGGRILVGCRTHRLRLDSARGDLTSAALDAAPDEAALGFFRRVQARGEVFNARGRTVVTAHRTHKIVD